MTTDTDSPERTARCGCGALSVTVSGAPVEVYACSCRNCQRESGSAFTYAALYPKEAVAIAGARKHWRRRVDSGRWLESAFCPTCGVTLCFRSEGAPDLVGVSAGCFADAGFPPPERLYWGSRRHHWLALPDGTEILDTQPD